MVGKNIRTETLLELVFSASGETEEQLILKKSIPLYLRKLNCFLAGVLKIENGKAEVSMLIPFVAGTSGDWNHAKVYFEKRMELGEGMALRLQLNDSFYYAYYLNSYGILILGRKKAFDDTFTHELEPIANHLGTILIQAREIEQRKNAEKSLRESDQRFRTLSDTTTAGIFIFHGNSIIHANRAAERISGYTIAELNTLNILDFVHPDFKDLFQQRREIYLSAKEESSHFEIKVVHKDGRERWMDLNLGLIQWKGKMAGIISAFDTTLHKQAEEDLIREKEKAQESDRLKSAFLANMSHEIRTPMNGILGFASLLKEPNLTGEKQEMYLHIIEKSGNRMLNIINDIVDISKIESGLMEVSIVETNINKQMEYIFNFFKPEVENKGLNLTYHNFLPSDKAFIRTDKEKIYAILINLVKNAIKYTNEGSIEIGYDIKNGNIEFFVKDTGIGIPRDKHRMIFDRFVQTDSSLNSKYEGAGLGLAITKAYVEMLGGKIRVESEVGKGSEFYFTIPYLVFHEENHPEINTNKILAGNHIQAKLKILIIEDDEASILFLKIALKEFSDHILVKKNGLDGVEAFRKNQDVDLVLMDIRIPGIDGYEATRQIRKFNNHVLIVAQTAFGLSSDRDKAIESGCNDYISKPINREVLIGIINQCLERKAITENVITSG